MSRVRFVNNTSSSTTCFSDTNHLAVKVAVKYDISISVEISSNAVSTSHQSLWLVGTS